MKLKDLKLPKLLGKFGFTDKTDQSEKKHLSEAKNIDKSPQVSYTKISMDMINKIDPNHEYKPMEIAEAGWIKNTEGQKDYKYILKLIKNGKIPARNVAVSGVTPYYRVLGKNIISYIHAINEAHNSSEQDGKEQNLPVNSA
jgi:ribosomal protein L15